MSDKELVRKLYIDLCEASINKDLIKLGEILSDDYVLVHMTGMKQTKEDYLDSVKSGELSYFESKHESIDVNVNGDDATIIGKTKTLASPFGTRKLWWNLRQDLKINKKKIFIKQNNWIAIISIIFGLPLGFYLTDWLFKTAIEEHYDFGAWISVRTYIISAIGTFIVSYFVSKFLARKINKIDMVTSLKGNE